MKKFIQLSSDVTVAQDKVLGVVLKEVTSPSYRGTGQYETHVVIAGGSIKFPGSCVRQATELLNEQTTTLLPNPLRSIDVW